MHEGPQSISKAGMTVLEPGMIISNEPGYYKTGAYGIRIENLVLVSEPEKVAGGEREVMSFETLTLVPIDRRLVVPEMLSPAELDWLNAYHARACARSSGRNSGRRTARGWSRRRRAVSSPQLFSGERVRVRGGKGGASSALTSCRRPLRPALSPVRTGEGEGEGGAILAHGLQIGFADWR